MIVAPVWVRVFCVCVCQRGILTHTLVLTHKDSHQTAGHSHTKGHPIRRECEKERLGC